jgi:hypothetical protein
MTAGPRKAFGRSRPAAAAAPEPTGNVPVFTVLLDVSANLLCVVVLLLTVSATAQSRRASMTEVGFPIVVGEVLAPADLVEAFRLRTVRDDGVSTIDLRRAHVEVKPAGTSPAVELPLSIADPDFASLLRRSLAPEAGKVLVFVFSQDGHGALRRSLDELAASVTEVDVPVALRAAGPDGGWSRAFRSLFDDGLGRDGFPGRLARIIAGSEGAGQPERAPADREAGTSGMRTKFWTVLQAGWRLSLLALSVYAMVLVGRMRPLAP